MCNRLLGFPQRQRSGRTMQLRLQREGIHWKRVLEVGANILRAIWEDGTALLALTAQCAR